MHASDVMSSPVYVIELQDTVAHARNLMIRHKISRCPVLKDGILRGIITKKDLVYGLRQSEPIWRRRPIDRIPVEILMANDPVTIEPSTAIGKIASIMVSREISGLPVMEDGELVGIVTKSDLLGSELVNRLSATIAKLMEPVEIVSRYHSLDHVIDIMSEQSNKVVVVNNDGTIAGIITESNLAFFIYMNEKTELPQRDIRFLRREESAGRKSYRYVFDVSSVAEDFMSHPVVTVSNPDAPIQDAIRLMREHHINSVVVADEKELKGIVKRDDIIQEVAK